ncbi:MAG: EAL domain-containing protein [Gammaproteobacteria bacterium]|nr:EAL domain-containing protein [Gammaproteobacteria bacterium]
MMIDGRQKKSNVVELNQNLKDREIEIELLQKTFAEIGSELDLDKIFQIVSVQARALIQAETVLVPLLDENCETYTYRGGAGKNAEEIVGESLPLEFGVCGWVWKHKRPWWLGVLDELSEDEKNLWEEEAGSMIMVPLQGRRHFLGGISGINKIGGGEFSRRDLNLLQMFASIVSIAIENAMAVGNMEKTSRINDDYRMRLEILNKQLLESSKELEYLSLYDIVTGLPNRSLFHDRLSRNVSQAILTEEHIGILLIDLDRFKEVNEALGHERGDLLLKKIARRFERHMRLDETLARLGGDEFVIILPDCDEAQSMQRAKEFKTLLYEPFNIANMKMAVSGSIGVAVFPEQGEDASSLLSHADSAMYEAKNNQVGLCLYNPAHDLMTRGHLVMIADIHRALKEKQFELYYQPKITLKDNQLIAAEALGRWISEERGMVSPDHFIKVLEQNSLLDEYTYWAIETALQQAIIWNKKQVLRIAVNLSPQTLMDPDFIENLNQIIGDRKNGEYLTFEITENLFLSEYDTLSSVLEHIRQLGIELSIDDYGTGYSSLSRLIKLPVNELKIDKSFVKNVDTNNDDETVVRSTIELAHNLDMKVVAEGVESEAVMDLLRRYDCDIAQGFLISKPLPVAEFEAFLDNYR